MPTTPSVNSDGNHPAASRSRTALVSIWPRGIQPAWSPGWSGSLHGSAIAVAAGERRRPDVVAEREPLGVPHRAHEGTDGRHVPDGRAVFQPVVDAIIIAD